MENINTSRLKVPVECWSRICGYFRPLHDWNKGKRQEFEDRKPVKIRTEYHDNISPKNN
jgi:anaerobic ribonucleoside-triphosphate reductase